MSKQDSKITDQINASIAKAFAILSEDFKEMVDNAKAELLEELPSLVTSEVQFFFPILFLRAIFKSSQQTLLVSQKSSRLSMQRSLIKLLRLSTTIK